MSEQQIIERIRKQVGNERLELGIGDDCAIYRPKAGEDLLFTTDFLIEDVHFKRDIFPPENIGHKALARSLSDIAAMGGDPRFCLLSLALPPAIDQLWIDKFFNGFLKLAKRCKVTLAGGDLARAAKVTCDVMVCGSVPKGKALRRDGAKPGDIIYVSGPLGKPWQTHQRPEPRLELGKSLRGRASAAMDVSDGISIDLHRLCKASGVSSELEYIPVVKGSTLDSALHGGEDYELLFTMPPRRKAPKGCIRVGWIDNGDPGLIKFQEAALEPLGHDHFRS
jgi:thiamine-monophosphate kinase